MRNYHRELLQHERLRDCKSFVLNSRSCSYACFFCELLALLRACQIHEPEGREEGAAEEHGERRRRPVLNEDFRVIGISSFRRSELELSVRSCAVAVIFKYYIVKFLF